MILDPNENEAALFTGDAYFKKKEMDKAGEWFARAVPSIPIRKPIRYRGDALAQSGKNRDAFEKYVDAIVAEPYKRQSSVGLIQFANTSVPLTQPHIVSQTRSSRRQSNEYYDRCDTLDKKTALPIG